MRITINIINLLIIWSFFYQNSYAQSNNKIPFKFEKNEIIIKVKINNKGPYNFLFDTGTNPSVINIKNAKRVRLQLNEINRKVGKKNKTKIYLCYLPKITVGKISQDSLLSVALNLSVFKTKFIEPIEGIIGYSFFNNKIFTIDYAKREILFYKKLPTINTTLVKEKMILSKAKSIPEINNVSLDGHLLNLLLDTGSRFSLNILESTDSLYKFSKSIVSLKPDTIRKYNKSIIVSSGKIKYFKLGKIKLKDVPVIITPSANDSPKDYKGSIGNEFLSHYKVTFDYIDKTLIISN